MFYSNENDIQLHTATWVDLVHITEPGTKEHMLHPWLYEAQKQQNESVLSEARTVVTLAGRVSDWGGRGPKGASKELVTICFLVWMLVMGRLLSL